MQRFRSIFAFSVLLGLLFCFLAWNFLEMKQLELENEFLADLVKTLEVKIKENVPSTEHELARFKVRRDVNELWNFVRAKFEHSIAEARNRSDNITVLLWDQTLKSGRHRYNVIKRDLEVLSGMGYQILFILNLSVDVFQIKFVFICWFDFVR